MLRVLREEVQLNLVLTEVQFVFVLVVLLLVEEPRNLLVAIFSLLLFFMLVVGWLCKQLQGLVHVLGTLGAVGGTNLLLGFF